MKRSVMLMIGLVGIIAALDAQNLATVNTIPGMQPGSMLVLRLRGETTGQVWGTDIYTADSALGAAAVHAGVLAPGATGVVYVEVLPGLASYAGSSRNGVTSQGWGNFGLSFRFLPVGTQAVATTPQPQTSTIQPPATVPPPTVIAEPARIFAFKDESAITAIPFIPGTSFYCRVTGTTSGRVWGTDIYTSDSSLNTAAVHAGLVQPGQSTVVKVTMQGPRQSYQGSTRNGVTTASYGSYGASYTIASAPSNAQVIEMIPAPDKAHQISGYAPYKSFVLWVTGQSSGAVWGTDIYTIDSSIGAAAVHAGLLRVGEAGPVLIQILPGLNAYVGSTRNGITTASYGGYPTSYSLSPAR